MRENISEIGLASPDPDELADGLIEKFGLTKYGSTSFFVGDEYGLFVLPEVGRPWIPELRQTAAVHPAKIFVQGGGGRLDINGLPYTIGTANEDYQY